MKSLLSHNLSEPPRIAPCPVDIFIRREEFDGMRRCWWIAECPTRFTRMFMNVPAPGLVEVCDVVVHGEHNLVAPVDAFMFYPPRTTRKAIHEAPHMILFNTLATGSKIEVVLRFVGEIPKKLTCFRDRDIHAASGSAGGRYLAQPMSEGAIQIGLRGVAHLDTGPR